ncbi:phosphatase PAP2 family protein [Myceligenerans crystallogenes]|uniref:Phosphatidic acid phosphatase type 2/haloperoxidase domain-containing protein n=1 Tax=Myceligenerans crystallogenes TaxID=316335 RepID=A0ABP4ZUG7_9MICO
MLRFQGAQFQGASYPAGPGEDDLSGGRFVVIDRTLTATSVTEPGATRAAVSAVADHVRADLRTVRHGTLAESWVAPAATGVLLVLAFAWAVFQVAAAGPFVAWDQISREWVYAHRATGFAEALLEFQAFVTGERWVTVPVAMGVAALVAYRQHWLRPLYAVTAGLATIAAIGYPVKFGLGRSSPVTGLDVLHAGGQAFPSGHAANTAFTATVVVFLLYGSAGLRPDREKFRRGVLYVGGLLGVTGVLVLLMGYHWLSDIPGGWLMGFIAVCVSLTVLHWPRRAGDEAREVDREAAASRVSRW